MWKQVAYSNKKVLMEEYPVQDFKLAQTVSECLLILTAPIKLARIWCQSVHGRTRACHARRRRSLLLGTARANDYAHSPTVVSDDGRYRNSQDFNVSVRRKASPRFASPYNAGSSPVTHSSCKKTTV